ncbi:helix-turn-helix domain-containing protein [Flavobacterium sp. U410]
MSILSKNILLLFLLLSGFLLYPQKSYNELRSLYDSLEENNEKALPFVNSYLEKAKEEKNYTNIVQGYKDAVFYSKDPETKLKYADSCINYSLKSNNHELISRAYLGKGIIYYFFYRKYQPALNEYLKAYQFSKDIHDEYLKYRIIYHLGVVKSYLGYYKDAIELFDDCIHYFEPLTKTNHHPNIIFNHQKGYFNSIHQEIICYRNLKNFIKSDSLISVGLSNVPKSKEFALEKSYFLECMAISQYRKANYEGAIENLSKALPEFQKIDDFTWASATYFYLGKSYQKLKKEDIAISYFIKVDSVFQKQKFILPELRENYEILINHYNLAHNPEYELYYTKQLLMADRILGRDFHYLSSRIHKEYDTKSLLEKQKLLEGKNSISLILLSVAILMIVFLFLVILYRKKKEKEIQKKYEALEVRILDQKQLPPIPSVHKENKTEIPSAVIENILQKLEKFEQRKEFRKKGLTASELARKFETNTTYLSYVINEYKKKNFNGYLNFLRINYITQQLYHNKKYLEYTVEGLSENCGISSRQNFSDLFYEINGIRPGDFIKKRRKELKENIEIDNV